jgi:hypothetical protein
LTASAVVFAVMLFAFNVILLEFRLCDLNFRFLRHKEQIIIAQSIQAVIYNGDGDPEKK